LGALILVACGAGSGGFDDGTFAIIANTDIGAGEVPARILIGVVGEDGARLGDPETRIEVEVAPATDLGATQRTEAEFDWIVENAVGLYRASFVFDSPGVWWMTVEPEGGSPLKRVAFNVIEDTATPNVGEPAVVTATPTLRDLNMVELTTDPDPDPRFYELSLDEAIASGRRTVLTFSTPAYCQTAACGPLLETVKETADSYPDTNFIHVEVYTGLTEPDFAPDPAHLAPSVTAEFWNLPSEPWVFIIDPNGLVTARFEGVMSAEELTDALG
jgi:hypothetical protein